MRAEAASHVALGEANGSIVLRTGGDPTAFKRLNHSDLDCWISRQTVYMRAEKAPQSACFEQSIEIRYW